MTAFIQHSEKGKNQRDTKQIKLSVVGDGARLTTKRRGNFFT